VRSGGRARVLARPAGSLYLTAGAEIVWLGPVTGPLHPRAILTGGVPAATVNDDLRVDVAALPPWRPAPLALDLAAAHALRDGTRRLVADVGRLGTPHGFGALLVGEPLRFPLTEARETAHALARAFAADDAGAALAAALGLLGLGEGLTPSGDDLVGGALFARRMLADAGACDVDAWSDISNAVLTAAPARTHPISVALLADLAAGATYAPLHDLVAALATGARSRALQAAAEVVRIGHSSGWDILTGLSAGLGALHG
jgi:hypothetical protein